MNILACILFLAALVFGLSHVYSKLTRPLSRAEESKRRQLRSHLRIRAKTVSAAMREGKAPDIWVPKQYGPLGVRGFRAHEYLRAWADQRRAMQAWFAGRGAKCAMANIDVGFYDGGMATTYPSDVIPGSLSNPYLNRYMLVKQAPPGTTLAANLVPTGLVVSSDDICQIMGAADVSIPLGVMTDDVGNAPLDAPPYSGNVTYLGNAAKSTQQMVTDSAIVAGKLLIPSLTTAGFVGPVPNIAGVYWCPGMSISTSEGASTLIEVDAMRIPVSVDEIT